jgi:DnaJ family protein C protein 7
MNADAIFIRGLCLYYEDNIDKAFQHFQQVLRLAPDHLKAKETYKVSDLASVIHQNNSRI